MSEARESTTQEERQDFVHIMIHEVGVDVTFKRVRWVKARPDHDPLIYILDRLRPDDEQRYWILELGTDEDICDVREGLGQMTTGVKIAFPVSHNTLISPRSIYNDG